MITKLEKKDNYLYLEVTDMITKEDVEKVIPPVEEIIEKDKKMKCLVFLNNVKGYTLGGFFADFNFYIKHKDSFELFALVGDKEYEKLVIALFSKFLPGKSKYFDVSELEKAKEWIQQN